MLKKIFCLTVFFIMISAIQAKSEVIAPAIQYLRSDYPAAFLTNVDYAVKIKEHAKYRLKCESNIISVAIGDKENVKIRPTTDEEDEDKLLYEKMVNDVVLKTKNESYTYIQVFKEEGSPTAAFLHINKKNKTPEVINFGDCTLVERDY